MASPGAAPSAPIHARALTTGHARSAIRGLHATPGRRRYRDRAVTLGEGAALRFDPGANGRHLDRAVLGHARDAGGVHADDAAITGEDRRPGGAGVGVGAVAEVAGPAVGVA